MSTLATWPHVVQSRDVSPHNFDGLAMSGLALSVAPPHALISSSERLRCCPTRPTFLNEVLVGVFWLSGKTSFEEIRQNEHAHYI